MDNCNHNETHEESFGPYNDKVEVCNSCGKSRFHFPDGDISDWVEVDIKKTNESINKMLEEFKTTGKVSIAFDKDIPIEIFIEAMKNVESIDITDIRLIRGKDYIMDKHDNHEPDKKGK